MGQQKKIWLEEMEKLDDEPAGIECSRCGKELTHREYNALPFADSAPLWTTCDECEKEMEDPKTVTGVHNANYVCLWEEPFIDLDWEAHLEECGGDCLNCGEPEDTCECGEYDPSGDHNCCGPLECGTQLYGGWKKDKEGKYEPDVTSEYSCIFNPDHNTVQVVHSRYTVMCAPCSPCYPGQGDVDNPGPLMAYCLPYELLERHWLEQNAGKMKYSKDGKLMTLEDMKE